MSTSFITVFESEVPPYRTVGDDNLALSDMRDQLDRLAVGIGLTPLAAFESYGSEDTEGLLDDDEQAAQSPAEWFPPAAGLQAVEALRAHLDAHPGAIAQQAEMPQDLARVAVELRAAEQAGVRFRFAVVM